MNEQIAYLEKLLTGYRARYQGGEQTLIDKIRITAAKLAELKLQETYEDAKKVKPTLATSFTVAPRRGCCRGR